MQEYRSSAEVPLRTPLGELTALLAISLLVRRGASCPLPKTSPAIGSYSPNLRPLGPQTAIDILNVSNVYQKFLINAFVIFVNQFIMLVNVT